MKQPRIILRPVRAIFKRLEAGETTLRAIHESILRRGYTHGHWDRTGAQLVRWLGKLPRPAIEQIARDVLAGAK